MIISRDESLFSICDLYCENNDGALFLRWNWRNDVDEAAIYLLPEGREISDQLILSSQPLRRVTRREFGYGLPLSLDCFERVRLVIFPCFLDGGDTVLALQNDGRNELSVVPRRRNIEYRVRESSSLFSSVKNVVLEIRCDCTVPASLLCYVLKSSGASYPIPFELHPGDNTVDSLPSISRRDSVSLIFSDPARDAPLYNLRKLP